MTRALLPGEQHFAIFGDLVLPLLGAEEIVGIDILQPDENAANAGAGAFLDKIRQLVAQRVDLNDEADIELLHLPQVDQAIEDRLPVLVACEIVVGDEKTSQTLGVIDAHDLLDVISRAAARYSALHIDDGAERALIRAAAPRIETRDAAGRALRALRGHQRDRRAFDVRQIVHEIVERLECAGERIAQHLLEPAFRLAGKQREAHGSCAVEIGIDAVEHRERAGHVKSAHRHRDPAPAQWPRDVERARKLIRLHAGQHHHAGAGGLDQFGNPLGADAGIRLVKGMDVELDIFAEDAAFSAVLCQSVKRSKRVRRDGRAQPLNHVAVFIVMRRLDENQTEALAVLAPRSD